MNLFLDCEFNGWTESGTGELISMALVSGDSKYEFYEVIGCTNPSSFVIQHVLPVLGKEPIPKQDFSRKLLQFLRDVSIQTSEIITVIADYPSDIEVFTRALLLGPGKCLNTPELAFLIDLSLSTNESEFPHNALEDARALSRDFALKHQNKFLKFVTQSGSS